MAFGQRNRPEPEKKAAEQPAPQPAPAPEIQPQAAEPAVNGNGQRHTEATPKIIKGKLTGDPEARFTPTGKLIATLRIAEDLPEGKTPTTWKVSLWEDRGEDAIEKLRGGDGVKVIGRWEADRSYKNRENKDAWTTHEVTGQRVGVEVGDKTIPLEHFDRDALQAGKTLEQDPGPDFSTF